MKTRLSLLVLVCTAGAGAVLGIGFDRALAQQDGIKRTILTRADDPAAANRYEAVMGVAELAPGASSGKHRHPGIEIGYVLEGTVVIEHDGRSTATFKPGETFKMDGPHNARNGGAAPAKILAVYLVEKGKPLAEPVQ